MKWLRFGNRVRYVLERLMIRGPHYQLLLVAIAIGLISLIGGVVVMVGSGGFDSVGSATWWAFLRLSDPGYLGDDVGMLRRVVSTALTVLGYVVFLGLLIAILTRWLLDLMRRLERGVTPVALNNHIVIIGWTARTASLAAELLGSESRVKRFLARRGARKLHIAILAEEVGPEQMQELRDRAGEDWDSRQVTLRSGSSLRPDHIERIDFVNSAVALIPAQDGPGDSIELVDSRTIKTLLSLGGRLSAMEGRSLPVAVAELRDARKIPIALRAYEGPIEVIASDALAARLIVQNVRHPGLSHVTNEMLTLSEGTEVYIRDAGPFAGRRIEEALDGFPDGILLGVVRGRHGSYTARLNPPPGFVIDAEDRLVVMADTYDETAASEEDVAPVKRGVAHVERASEDAGVRRLLVLGWSHKTPALIAEFGTYAGERFELDVVSVVSAEERRRQVERYAGTLERVEVRQIEADYNFLPELRALAPWQYEQIVLMGSGRAVSEEDADARTLQGYLLLQQLFAEHGAAPRVLIELLEPENSELLSGRAGEVLISPMILGHVLAQVALRRELRAVFEELFTASGAEITFRGADRYGVAGREATFAEVQRAAWARGEIAIGLWARSRGAPVLNPGAASRWVLDAADEIVTIETCG